MKTELNSHQFPEVYECLGIKLDTLGCVMLDLEPLENMYSMDQEGAAHCLYYSKNPDRKWIDGWIADKEPHITLLYGLLDRGKNIEKHIDKVFEGWVCEDVEIEEVSYFDSPYSDEPYWCIVAHITKTPELVEGHHRLSFLPHINTYETYKPHMTICYIDKKQGEKWRDHLIANYNDLWKGKKMKVKALNLGY